MISLEMIGQFLKDRNFFLWVRDKNLCTFFEGRDSRGEDLILLEDDK